MEDFQAESVIEWLDSRFRTLGPPLVLKSDSGSAFIAEATGRGRGIRLLFSRDPDG